MVLRHVAVEEAYNVLGLDNGATIDEVKSAYKKLAFQTHPDKNPDVPDATAKFQQVGAAYTTLLKHLDRSSAPPRHSAPWQTYHDEDEDEYDDNSDEYYDDDEPEDLDFFIFIFEEVLRGRSGRRFHYAPRQRPRTPETEEQYQERLLRMHEERKAAEERRMRDGELLRERIRVEIVREREAAEQRQKQRASQKKARAEASRQSAAQKVRDQMERSQALRSATFAAARQGDAEKVKKGIWEDEVDAAGGELKRGSEAFIETRPKDLAETLLHIAASQGDTELVEWLINHNAEADEHNSAGLTAFHIALQKGYIPLVKYFFENHPPNQDDYRAIYTPPASHTLLRLAMSSAEPELVWMVLEHKLANKADIGDAWAWVCSDAGEAAVKRTPDKPKSKDDERRLEEIKNLLTAYGGFTPPPTPKVDTLSMKQRSADKPPPKRMAPESRITIPVLQNPTPRASPAPSDEAHQDRSPMADGAQRGFFRGRGRGRGRGSNRGHGRGGGGYKPNQQPNHNQPASA